MCMNDTEIYNRIQAGEKPSTLARENWERKIALVKEHKFEKYRGLRHFLNNSYILDRCALCSHYGDCEPCPLQKVDKSCTIDTRDSTFDLVIDSETHEELVTNMELMIEKLKEAEELESGTYVHEP